MLFCIDDGIDIFKSVLRNDPNVLKLLVVKIDDLKLGEDSHNLLLNLLRHKNSFAYMQDRYGLQISGDQHRKPIRLLINKSNTNMI